MTERLLGARYCLASVFENFGENVFIMESEKATPTPKFQNKGGQWDYGLLAPSVSPLGARSGRDLFPDQPGQNG